MDRKAFIEQFFPREPEESLTGAHIMGFLVSATVYDMEIVECEYPQQLKELAMGKYIGALEAAKTFIIGRIKEIEDAVILDIIDSKDIN